MAATVRLRFAAPLQVFLRARDRGPRDVVVSHDGTSSLGHVVQSLGVPLTEVGALRLCGRPVLPEHRPVDDDRVSVAQIPRPQPLARSAFLLDVHLGALSRRMRLLGLDVAYRNDADDDELVEQANREDRLLLTQDRGLLCRRALAHGAYVRGSGPAEQIADVLDRFRPRTAPFTRCVRCNGLLDDVAKSAVASQLEPGTLRSYERFRRCTACGAVYWRGAHAARLDASVAAALRRG